MKPATEHQLDITRTIYAPRDKVYAAWTETQHIAKWWLTDPFTDPVIEIDLKVGGSFRFGMRPAGGEHFYARGSFREVSAPARIVHTWQWEGAPMGADANETLVTIEFTERDGVTDLRILHTGFAEQGWAEEHTKGWNKCLDRMVEGIG